MQKNENLFQISEINPFRTKNPKDALSGITDGLANIVIGTVGALSSLVYSVLAGFRKRSLRGVAQGLFSGIILSSIISTLGTITGMIQVLRGILNTPVALKHLITNKKMWDSEESAWKTYALLEEYEAVAQKGSFHGIVASVRKRCESSNKYTPSEPKDSTLYERLGVSPTASFEEIKVAYFQLAVTQHPDKNPSPEATQRFQSITEAYRILSEPNHRKRYNEEGIQGYNESAGDRIENIQNNAVSVIFEILGGKELQLLIGPGIPSLYFIEGLLLTPEETKTIKKIQAVTISLNTIVFMDVFVKNLFSDACLSQAQENFNDTLHSLGVDPLTTESPLDLDKVDDLFRKIIDSPLGKHTLYFLGGSYIEIAKEFLSSQRAWYHPNYSRMFRRGKKAIGNIMKMSMSSASLTKTVYQMSKKIKKEDEESTRVLLTANLESISRDISNILWYFWTNSMHGVFRSVQGLLLYDEAATVEKRCARCHALIAFGKYLQQKGEEYDWNPTVDVLSRM